MTLGETPETHEGLRVVKQEIVATYIFSSDGLLLLGQKNPEKPGAYPDAWHTPGGVVKNGESFVDAAAREAREEVIGLDVTADDLAELDIPLQGRAPKQLESGENVLCEMDFYHFETQLGQTALELINTFSPGDDLGSLEWFSRYALRHIPLIPGGREVMAQAGYIDS